MEEKKSYCQFAYHLDKNNVHKIYHDKHYGFPISNDDELFGRLILEINQAGLSWTTILNKQENFRKAYHNFNIKKIASYTESDRIRLLNNEGIIRNRLKIEAAIFNANATLGIQKEFGSFKHWLDKIHFDNNKPLKDEWVKIFKKKFKFTGGEIVNEFLMSTGYLKGAHTEDCPVHSKVLKANPNWNK